jgi:diguanylate cyclase (GGDEF)-like protein/PAS domain S-box-containing protein
MVLRISKAGKKVGKTSRRGRGKPAVRSARKPAPKSRVKASAAPRTKAKTGASKPRAVAPKPFTPKIRRAEPYEHAVDALGEAIVSADLKGIVVHANPAAARLFGDKPSVMIGRSLGQYLTDPAYTRESAAALLARVTERLATIHRGLIGQRGDGSRFTVDVTGTRMTQPGGAAYIVIFRDVSQQTADMVKLRRAAAVFDATTEGIMVLSLDWRIEAVNRAFSAITGFEEHEVQGRKPGFLTAKKVNPRLADTVSAAVREDGRWDADVRSNRKNGEAYSERLTVTGIRDDKGSITGYVAVMADVTQRRADEERIRYQANYDALTGLPNRTLFMDRLQLAVNSAERNRVRVALMFIDLDGFKLVNDTLGHDAGDELLREAARRLTMTVRAGDTVARLGGDEFTVVMPNLPEAHPAPVVAQRIITALEEPFRFKNQEALVSASIGITVFPNDGRDVQTLLRNADAAMYQAKESGKANYRFYTADLNAQATERLTIKSGLAKALKRNEFQLDYLPRRELASGRITGVEALLRWTSRELGSMPPGKFIPIAEETGAIGAIGEWTLAEAFERQRAWSAAGLGDVRVAINLSGRQLRQPNIVQLIGAQIDRAGISPQGVEIEITELIVMRDADHSAATLRQLANMGVRIILDDFGTGYSSLSVLKRFPVDMIKVDQTLVRPIATDTDSLEIVRAIISMGHSLRRRIVAEGVENEAQLKRLTDLQCDEIQGYLVSPPVSAKHIDDILVTANRAVPV